MTDARPTAIFVPYDHSEGTADLGQSAVESRGSSSLSMANEPEADNPLANSCVGPPAP